MSGPTRQWDWPHRESGLPPLVRKRERGWVEVRVSLWWPVLLLAMVVGGNLLVALSRLIGGLL